MQLQQLNNKLKFKSFINLLLFKIMKKQLFLTVMAVMATLVSLGQALPGSAPRGINCTDGPLNPIAGKLYSYIAESNQTGDFTFWATKDPNFVVTDAAGVTTNNLASRLLTTAVAPATTPDLIATSSNYGTANAAKQVDITWSDALLSGLTAANPAFVAAMQQGTCTNNFKAWAIVPIKAFTVDIRNMKDSLTAALAFDATTAQCFDIVRSAKYNAGKVEYNYGKQVLYFEVIAANFTNSWTPTFTVTGLMPAAPATAVQTAIVEWTYQNPVTTPWTAATVWNPASTVVTTNQTSTTNGVSIYVRVTVRNNTYEGIAATPITLTVDGVNSVNDWDIENNTLTDKGPLCNAGVLNDKMDAATQTINPRPTVTPVTPNTFITGNNVN